MSVTRTFLTISVSCALCVIGLIFFELEISHWLTNKSEIYTALIRGVLWITILTAALIPFGILGYHLSIWVEKITADSVLYSGKPDGR